MKISKTKILVAWLLITSITCPLFVNANMEIPSENRTSIYSGSIDQPITTNFVKSEEQRINRKEIKMSNFNADLYKAYLQKGYKVDLDERELSDSDSQVKETLDNKYRNYIQESNKQLYKVQSIEKNQLTDTERWYVQWEKESREMKPEFRNTMYTGWNPNFDESTWDRINDNWQEIEVKPLLKPLYVFIQNENYDKSGLEYKIEIDVNSKIDLMKKVLLEENDNIDINGRIVTFKWKIAWHIDSWIFRILDEWIKSIKINWTEINFEDTTKFTTDNNIQVIITKGLNDDTKKILEYYGESVNQWQEMREERDNIRENSDRGSLKEELNILIQKYSELRKNNASQEELDTVKNQIVEVQNKIRELSQTIMTDKTDINKALVNEKKDFIEKIKTKREEYKPKYKDVFIKKIGWVLDKLSNDKLNLILKKIDTMISQVESNTKISSDKKDILLSQLDALKEIISEKLDITISEEINLDEILK